MTVYVKMKQREVACLCRLCDSLI